MKPDVGNELYIEIVFFINDVFLTCIQMRHRCYVFQKQKLKFKFLFSVGCYGETGPRDYDCNVKTNIKIVYGNKNMYVN